MSWEFVIGIFAFILIAGIIGGIVSAIQKEKHRKQLIIQAEQEKQLKAERLAERKKQQEIEQAERGRHQAIAEQKRQHKEQERQRRVEQESQRRAEQESQRRAEQEKPVISKLLIPTQKIGLSLMLALKEIKYDIDNNEFAQKREMISAGGSWVIVLNSPEKEEKIQTAFLKYDIHVLTSEQSIREYTDEEEQVYKEYFEIYKYFMSDAQHELFW